MYAKILKMNLLKIVGQGIIFVNIAKIKTKYKNQYLIFFVILEFLMMIKKYIFVVSFLE
jgi:hypothetical protein